MNGDLGPVVIKRNVDPSELPESGRTLEQFRNDAVFLAEHEEELLQQYPDQWIAVFEGKVVAHSTRRRAMERDLRQQGILSLSPVTEFLNTKPVTLIL